MLTLTGPGISWPTQSNDRPAARGILALPGAAAHFAYIVVVAIRAAAVMGG